MSNTTLDTRKEEAKRIVRAHLFRDYADNTSENTAIQQRIYERKALMALLHIKGIHTANLLTDEATIRGTTVGQLAATILTQSEELNQKETLRMEINVEIDQCSSISDIGKLLIDKKIPLPPGIVYFDGETTS